MSTNFFSSLSGSFDYVSSMSGLLSDYSSIKSGAYGSLMKSYVNKVGNKAALNAYRETGSTTTGAASEVASSKSGSANKSSFLDSYFNDIKNSGSTPKSSSKESSDSSSTTSSTATTTTDAYAKYKLYSK